jgi:DNA-binding CsgD family transcriptional regulator
MKHSIQSIHNTNNALQRLAYTAFRIGSLPSAPTYDWPTNAANTLAQLTPNAAFAVIIANIDPAYHRIHTDASGVCDNTNHPATSNPYESRATLDRLGTISHRHAQNLYADTLVTDASSLLPQWYASESSTHWRSSLPQRTLVGYAPLSNSTHPNSTIPSQRIALICIATPNPSTADHIDHDMFASAICTLAHKGSAINNSQPNGTINWLTQREQTILDQLILGYSVREIAEEVNRSPHTVHDHVKNLHKKLNATSRGQLIAKALGHEDQTNARPAAQPIIDQELIASVSEMIETKKFNPVDREDRVRAQPLSRSATAL